MYARAYIIFTNRKQDISNKLEKLKKKEEKDLGLTFSRTAAGSMPNLSAIGTIRSGRLPEARKPLLITIVIL